MNVANTKQSIYFRCFLLTLECSGQGGEEMTQVQQATIISAAVSATEEKQSLGIKGLGRMCK